MNTRTEVPDNTLGPYDENRLSAYAAAAINQADYQRIFVIGDGQISTLNGMQFVNSPLRANQAYVFFIRLYSSVPVSYMYNEEIGREGRRERGRKGMGGGRGKEKREGNGRREGEGEIKERRKRGWLRVRGRRWSYQKMEFTLPSINFHECQRAVWRYCGF